MSLFTKIRRFFAGGRYDDIAQTQTEAVIDALALAVLADGEVADRERRHLRRALEEFKWEGSLPLDVYLDDALDHARQTIEKPDSDGLDDYIADISERLEQQALREDAYFLSAKIAAADKGILEPEREFLQQMVQTFEIDRDRLQTLTRELLQEF